MWKHGDRPVVAPRPRYTSPTFMAAMAALFAGFRPVPEKQDLTPVRKRGRYVLRMGSAMAWGSSHAGATCCDSKRSRRRHRHESPVGAL